MLKSNLDWTELKICSTSTSDPVVVSKDVSVEVESLHRYQAQWPTAQVTRAADVYQLP